jgi:hypothetical protein
MLGGMEPLVINPSADGMSGTYPTLSSLEVTYKIELNQKERCQVLMNTYFIPYAHGKGKL